MEFIAERMRMELEGRGDLPKLANAASGWFAISPAKWSRLAQRAQDDGRDGPSLIVYRTNTNDEFDHYVIPYAAVAPLLTDATAPARANGKPGRWELTLSTDSGHAQRSCNRCRALPRRASFWRDVRERRRPARSNGESA